MPGIYEATQVGKKEDVADEIYNIEIADGRTDTPALMMLRKDSQYKNVLREVQVELYDDEGHGGVLDGADVSEYGSQGRAVIRNRAQKFRVPFKVTDFAEIGDIYGAASEYARQKVIAQVKLRRKMEKRICSSSAASEDNGTTTNGTAGFFKWLNSASVGTGTYDIPTGYAIGSGQEYTSTVAALTESAFIALLKEACEQRRGAIVDLVGLVGLDLQERIDKYTAYDTPTGSDVAIRSYNLNGQSKEVIRAVSIIKSSFGVVKLVPTTMNLADATTGAASSGSPRSGVLIDPNLWCIRQARAPRTVDQTDQGGGPRGFCDSIIALECKNPMGQVRIECSS